MRKLKKKVLSCLFAVLILATAGSVVPSSIKKNTTGKESEYTINSDMNSDNDNNDTKNNN